MIQSATVMPSVLASKVVSPVVLPYSAVPLANKMVR